MLDSVDVARPEGTAVAQGVGLAAVLFARENAEQPPVVLAVNERVETGPVEAFFLDAEKCSKEAGRHGVGCYAVGRRDQVARLPGAQRLTNARSTCGADAEARQKIRGLVVVKVDSDDIGGLPREGASNREVGQEAAGAAPVEIGKEG